MAEVKEDPFIRLVKAEMKAQDVSMAALARKAGTARPYLHRVLHSLHVPSIGWCRKVGAVLGIYVSFQVRRKTGRQRQTAE